MAQNLLATNYITKFLDVILKPSQGFNITKRWKKHFQGEKLKTAAKQDLNKILKVNNNKISITHQNISKRPMRRWQKANKERR